MTKLYMTDFGELVLTAQRSRRKSLDAKGWMKQPQSTGHSRAAAPKLARAVLISATALHWFVDGSKHSTLLSVMKWF